MKRKIITINEDLCNGCGNCIPDCPEGALKLIDGKARLVSDLFCDGLGACVGACPTGAMSVVEREAAPYDERTVMIEGIIPKGENTIKEHLIHLHSHGETGFLKKALAVLKEENIDIPEYLPQETPCGCQQENRTIEKEAAEADAEQPTGSIQSALKQWPIQMHLLNPSAPFFDNCELLLSADCVPYAYGEFHREFLKDKIVITLCPKLDQSNDRYIDKLSAILEAHQIKSITVARMEVPCCGGTSYIAQEAIKRSGKTIPFAEAIISINGKRK